MRTVALANSTVMPSFGSIGLASTQTANTWYPDRYAPASFLNAGSLFGMDDVLALGISSADRLDHRPTVNQNQFSNTQGRKYDVNASFDGAPVTMMAWLYIPSSWADSSNGFRRTDMWGTVTDPDKGSDGLAYPVLGFTNWDAAGARFRGFDSDGWHDFAAPVLYNSWNLLAITLGGSAAGAPQIVYIVNGQPVYTAGASSPAGARYLSNVMLQAYNFDLSMGANASPDYTAWWANPDDQAPEPGTWLMLASGLAAAAWMRRRR